MPPTFRFVPAPPRLMAQFLEQEPVELARGEITDEDCAELTDGMSENWEVWFEEPMGRKDAVTYGEVRPEPRSIASDRQLALAPEGIEL
jgi:hypothetical protein